MRNFVLSASLLSKALQKNGMNIKKKKKKSFNVLNGPENLKKAMFLYHPSTAHTTTNYFMPMIGS